MKVKLFSGVQYINLRDGYPPLTITRELSYAFNMTYETALPGGMTVASFDIPWTHRDIPFDVVGTAVGFYDYGECTWCGYVSSVTLKDTGGDRSLHVSCEGPWARASTVPFSQEYPTATYSLQNVVTAAIGNIPDVSVIISGSMWSDVATALPTVSWSDSTPQQVISDAINYGDSSACQWSFIIMPPSFRAAGLSGNASLPDWSTGTEVDWMTVAVRDRTFGRNLLPLVDSTHGIKCVSPSTGIAHAYKVYSSGCTDMAAAGWFYIPKNAPNIQHEYVGFFTSTSTPIAYLKSTTITGALQLRNEAGGATYTSSPSIVVGLGSWHWMAIRTITSKTVGQAYCRYDGPLVVSQTGINTGSVPVTLVRWGPSITGAGAVRTLWFDDTAVTHAEPVPQQNQGVQGNYLISSLFKLDTGCCHFVVNKNDMESFMFSQDAGAMVNALTVAYSGGYTALSTCSASIERYGLYHEQKSVTQIDATQAGYYKTRYLQQYRSPRNVFESSFRLTRPVRDAEGGVMPLARIKAGMAFRIENLGELGNIYVGHTRYQAASVDQPESLEITPQEPQISLSIALARKQDR